MNARNGTMSKTILITGATDGIGLLTAELLHDAGNNVVLHGRNRSKLDAAAAKISRTSGADIGTHVCDLADLEQVDVFANAVRDRHERLDVLINNAGVFKTPDPRTASGLDTRFVVNAIAPYKLTRGLMASVPSDGRIINLSSAAQAPVDFTALYGQRQLSDMDAYAQSKRAITLWSIALATECASGPSIIAVNPGSLLASKMVQQGFGVPGNDLHIGADLLVEMATSDKFANVTGRYFDNDAGAFADVDGSQADEVIRAMNDLTK